METKLGKILEQKGRLIHSVQVDETVYSAIVRMDDLNIGSLLVLSGERLVGIMTERDYLRKVITKGRSSKTTLIEEIMTPNPITMTPDHSVKQAMAMMTAGNCRHIPVIAGDKPIGMISNRDLVKAIITEQELQIQMLESYMYGTA